MTDEKTHYQAVWRKAYRDGKGFDLELPTPADAVRTRMALYRAVKEVRDGKSLDQELKDATQNVSLRIVKERPNIVEVRHINQSAILQSIRQAVGDAELLGKKEGADEIKASQNRLFERMKQEGLPVEGEVTSEMPAPGTRVTPYYTR